MSMNVTPSTGTNLLDVTIDTDLNMIDASGNIVEDTDSITAENIMQIKALTSLPKTLTLLIITQAAQTTPRMTVPTMMVPMMTVPTMTVPMMMVPTMTVPTMTVLTMMVLTMTVLTMMVLTMIAKNSDNLS